LRNKLRRQPLTLRERKRSTMTRLMIFIGASAIATGDLLLLAAPAAAQQTNEITVYGNDPCPRSTGSAVYVCHRRPETERYRLPKNQQLQGTRQQRQSWANKAKQLMTVGNTGTGQCSPVGPGGHTGCLVQEINTAKQDAQEQQQQSAVPEK
jgi:hypothetical protein